MNLQDRVCVVTGGAGGLGLGAVECLLERGAKVAVLDVKENMAAHLMHNSRLLYCQTNVSDEAAVVKAIGATVARFGTIHVCVNVAGIFETAPIVGNDGVFPIEKFRRVLDVNLIGSFIVLCRAAEQMVKNIQDDRAPERGIIINTSSIRAFEGGAGGAAYTASKGALAAMTLSMARDLQGHAIRVNTIAPGAMDTDLFRALPADAAASHLARLVFPKRNGSPREFGALICHVVENEYINGETIRLDGALRV
jgi:3-hydroxyacyl-CoA dehydrogenase / 3-hydroxy-2-methylbutyryl-CoA dehydrogenase